MVGRLVSSVSSQLAMASEGKDTVVPQNLSNIMWSLPELRVAAAGGRSLWRLAIGQIERHVADPRRQVRAPAHIANTLLASSQDSVIDRAREMPWTPWRRRFPTWMQASMDPAGVEQQPCMRSVRLNAGQPLTVHELLVASMRKAGMSSVPNTAAMSLKGLALRAAPLRATANGHGGEAAYLGCLEALRVHRRRLFADGPEPSDALKTSPTRHGAWHVSAVRDASVFSRRSAADFWGQSSREMGRLARRTPHGGCHH